MKSPILMHAKKGNWPLATLLLDTPGFRVGNPEFTFELESENDETVFICKEQSLRLIRSVKVLGNCAVIRCRLENAGTKEATPIDILEPLHLVFNHPVDRWRHIFANGGTTENFYPPTAYRTHEWTKATQKLQIESHPQGCSSNLYLPLLISLSSTAKDAEGLFVGMEWSGAWYITFDKTEDGRSCLSAGVKVRGLSLAPKETLVLPEVHIGFFKGGPSEGTNALRRYLYQHVCPSYRGKPVIPRVSYDHWFSIGNNLNFDLMKREAEHAAKLGVEVFVVDASWFPGDFPYGVGNWDQVDKKKFPDGLEPLSEYVRSLGMDFGLWFEIERAVEGTSIVRDHPEWFVPISGRGKKRTYHLNLAIREAQDYIIELVGSWIKRLDLRWSRWDYNTEPMPFWEKVDPTLKIQFEYFKGLYRVLDTLMRNHPKWMVEGCAGGGRRIDIGTMRRAHTYWFSDQTHSAPLCRYMQARANRFLPGHLLNSSVAVGPGEGDAEFGDTSVLSRMLGKLAFDGDIASWSPSLTARMARWVNEFKAIRHLVVQDFYQLLPQPLTAEDWDAVQFVSYEGDEAAVFVFAGSTGGKRLIPLQGLSSRHSYIVRHAGGNTSTSVEGSWRVVAS